MAKGMETSFPQFHRLARDYLRPYDPAVHFFLHERYVKGQPHRAIFRFLKTGRKAMTDAEKALRRGLAKKTGLNSKQLSKLFNEPTLYTRLPEMGTRITTRYAKQGRLK